MLDEATKTWIESSLNDKSCESCHKQPGVMNSLYLFNSLESDPICGDWVCLSCEQEAEQEACVYANSPKTRRKINCMASRHGGRVPCGFSCLSLAGFDMITERDLQIAYFAGFHSGIIRASYHRDDTELETLIDEAMSDPERIYGFLTTFYNAWYCKNDKKGECLTPEQIVSQWQERRANNTISAKPPVIERFEYKKEYIGYRCCRNHYGRRVEYIIRPKLEGGKFDSASDDYGLCKECFDSLPRYLIKTSSKGD